MRLKIDKGRIGNISVYCIKQNQSQKNTIMCSNQYRNEHIFINSEKSKTFDIQRLVLNLIDKIDLQRGDKRLPRSDHSIYYIKEYKKDVRK